MQPDDHASGLDGWIGIHHLASLLQRDTLENVHTSEVAVVGKRAGDNQLSCVGHLLNVRHVALLNLPRFFGAFSRPLGTLMQEAHDIVRHLVFRLFLSRQKREAEHQ
jgi:hypothetical protein